MSKYASSERFSVNIMRDRIEITYPIYGGTLWIRTTSENGYISDQEADEILSELARLLIAVRNLIR